MRGEGCRDRDRDGEMGGECEDASRGDGDGAGGAGGDDGIEQQLPRRRDVLAFAGWGADGRELPFRRLCVHEGVMRPRALRATRFDGRAVAGALAVPVASSSTVRRLELPDEHEPLEDDVDVLRRLGHARACEVWDGQGEWSWRSGAHVAANVGTAHAARVARGLGHARRVAWAGLQAARVAIRSSLARAEAGMGRLLARGHTGAAGVQQQQRQQELQHDGPMLVEQLEHGDDEDGEPQQRAREESGSSSSRMDGEDERGTRAGMRRHRGLAQRKLCMHAGPFDRGESSSGLDFGEDISLLGAAGSGSGDAVRLMGCEGSVSLAWRTGEG